MFQRIREHFLDSFVAHLDRALHFYLCVASRGDITRENAQQPVGIDLKLYTPTRAFPRAAGAKEISNFPSIQLSLAISRSPCNTVIRIET